MLYHETVDVPSPYRGIQAGLVQQRLAQLHTLLWVLFVQARGRGGARPGHVTCVTISREYIHVQRLCACMYVYVVIAIVIVHVCVKLGLMYCSSITRFQFTFCSYNQSIVQFIRKWSLTHPSYIFIPTLPSCICESLHQLDALLEEADFRLQCSWVRGLGLAQALASLMQCP